MDATPIRLLVHGASGRMGRAVLRLAAADPRFAVVAAVARDPGSLDSLDAVPRIAANALGDCPPFDLAIDFSLPEALPAIAALCAERGAALVSGTTGLDESGYALLREAAGRSPVVWASNFSLGVAVMEELVRRAAGALSGWEVAITEVHHVHKKDVPSGTARTLALAIAAGSGRTPSIESIREGEVVGDHRVRFQAAGEVLELRHAAFDRDIFAAGALHAAALLAGRQAGLVRLGQLLFSEPS